MRKRQESKHLLKAAICKIITKSKSLYIHVPFCRRKCSYCGFYSVTHDSRLASSYVRSIIRQLSNIPGKFQTIYIGGGTPTTLEISQLEGLLKAVRNKALESCEFTIEANPESFDPAKSGLFLLYGVNRISIGVQSFDDAKLKRLGRAHDSASAVRAVRSAHGSGFKNISIDLIFGVRGQTLNGWKEDIKRAVSLPVKHISCYALDHKELEAGEDKAVAMYEYSIEYLGRHGFEQYEISNFARPGYRSRHNISYWENDPYIGLGPSAVSYINGKREENVADIHEYIKRVDSGLSVISSSEELKNEDRARETAALKIRTIDGIDFKWFKSKTGFDFLKLESGMLSKLSGDGLIRYKGMRGKTTGVALSRKGILFCDIVSGAFL